MSLSSRFASGHQFLPEKLDDTKAVIKKIEEENDNTMTNRKGQKTNNDPQNIIQNTEDWVTYQLN
jgi:hypothetical protein